MNNSLFSYIYLYWGDYYTYQKALPSLSGADGWLCLVKLGWILRRMVHC